MNKDWQADGEAEIEWDAEFAGELLGSYVLVGIAYRQADGTVVEQRQLHGYIRSVDPHYGIAVRPEGPDAGEDFNLPPMLDVFERAEEGVYTSKTGDVIRDPDFVAYWTVTAPQN